MPFDVEVVEFQINSMRRMASPADQNLATAGTGLKEVAVPVDPVSGTDMSGEVNRSAAYVRLLKKGSDEALGVYLVGLEDWFAGASEKVPVDGKTYDVSLRYKHMYKPYSMHLIDVKQDVYMGTQTARSYASQLRLVDATSNVDRTVKIWMNNPLRFAGETFYQSNYGRDRKHGCRIHRIAGRHQHRLEDSLCLLHDDRGRHVGPVLDHAGQLSQGPRRGTTRRTTRHTTRKSGGSAGHSAT